MKNSYLFLLSFIFAFPSNISAQMNNNEMLFTTIEKQSVADFTFSGEGGVHCIGDGEVIFIILGDEGGIFSIDGAAISGNSWIPIGTGTYTVTYEVSGDNLSKELKVIDVFNPRWSASNGLTICEKDLPLELEVEMSGGTWTTDINSEIYLKDGKIFFNADIENIDHGAFSITYEGGGQNCGQANTHVINVYNIPKAPEVVHPLEVACASEPTVIQMEGDPAFCNCPVRFNVYAENGEQIYAGDTFNDDVFDVSSFLEEGMNTFEVVTLNKICESDPVEVMIQVNSAIEVDLGEDQVVEVGETIILDAGNGGVIYSWSNGETSSMITVIESGTYSVTVTNQEGCFATDEVIIDFASGLMGIATLEEWQIFPNPTQNQVFIELYLLQNTDLKLEVKDLTGRTIQSKKYAFQKGKQHLQFSTSNWASGLYWLVLEGENGTAIQKLLKE